MSNNRYCEQCKYLNEHRTSGYCCKGKMTIPKERQSKQCVRSASCVSEEWKECNIRQV